jgi:hypothetical protein
MACAVAKILCASIERWALSSIPNVDYQFAELRLARIEFDYHHEVRSFL